MQVEKLLRNKGKNPFSPIEFHAVAVTQEGHFNARYEERVLEQAALKLGYKDAGKEDIFTRKQQQAAKKNPYPLLRALNKADIFPFEPTATSMFQAAKQHMLLQRCFWGKHGNGAIGFVFLFATALAMGALAAVSAHAIYIGAYQYLKILLPSIVALLCIVLKVTRRMDAENWFWKVRALKNYHWASTPLLEAALKAKAACSTLSDVKFSVVYLSPGNEEKDWETIALNVSSGKEAYTLHIEGNVSITSS